MMKKLISLALIVLSFSASAQTNVKLSQGKLTKKDTLAVSDSSRRGFLDIPEKHKNQRVGSFKLGQGVPVDTLDIGDERLRIVIKDDNTWYYIKSFNSETASEVLKEYWAPDVVNPYSRITLAEMPLRASICLVDSVSNFVCPYVAKVFSPFGYRHGRRHQGVDLPYKTGTPVRAAFDGVVRVSKYTSGYGNLIVIRHENGLETFYGHLSRREVEVGNWVNAGDEIGLGGSTGRSTGPHLHFETRYKGYAFDPQWVIDFEEGKLRANVFVLHRSYLNPSSHYVPQSIDEEEEIYAADEAIVEKAAKEAAEKAARKYHTVRSGDMISTIAKKYGKSQSTIMKLNPGINPNRLRIGQKIRVQ